MQARTLLVFLLFFFAACKRDRHVNTAFYYWKTVYSSKPTENSWMDTLHAKRLYVRIMDVDVAEFGSPPVPVSPVTFQDPIPAKFDLIPVVFIVNNVLKNKSHSQLDDLAAKLVFFVKGKVSQAGKNGFSELQIDCDWTSTTRDNYFYLLKKIKGNLATNKLLSVTLRLHQLKNLVTNGIPPADRVMLMCYNMGNLRQAGNQNSILDESELRKYLGANLGSYPLPVDVGLPLFSWAVAFRGSAYIGIAKKINAEVLKDRMRFAAIGDNRFAAKTDIADYGLKKGDEVRWESVSVKQLQSVAVYISKYLKSDTNQVIYFHLDETLLKNYTYDDLEKTTALFR